MQLSKGQWIGLGVVAFIGYYMLRSRGVLGDYGPEQTHAAATAKDLRTGSLGSGGFLIRIDGSVGGSESTPNGRQTVDQLGREFEKRATDYAGKAFDEYVGGFGGGSQDEDLSQYLE